MIADSGACYNGVSTRVLSVSGAGTPIVMFHGYGDSADTWRGVLARLGRSGRRALAVDLPGFGEAGPRDAGPLVPQFDGFADAVLAEVGASLLVGNSMGAAIAVRAAHRRPDLVKGLVALDDPLYARHLPAKIARRWEVPVMLWSMMGGVAVSTMPIRWAAGRTIRHMMRQQRDIDPYVLRHWQKSLATVRDIATLGRYAMQYAYETRTGHQGLVVKCPTVVVHGRRDRIIPVHSSLSLHQQIPGSELVVLPRSGHCPQLDNPDEVARLVLWLCDRVDSSNEGKCVASRR